MRGLLGRILQAQFIACVRCIERCMTRWADAFVGIDLIATVMADAKQMCDTGNLISMHPELMGTRTPDDGLGGEFAQLRFAFDDLVTATRCVGHVLVTNEPWPHGNLRCHPRQGFKESLALFTALSA